MPCVFKMSSDEILREADDASEEGVGGAGAETDPNQENNAAAVQRTINPFDLTPPVTAATLAGPFGTNGWLMAGSPVSLTLAATDDLSGVASTSYAINGGPAVNYAGPIAFADETYAVTYSSVDRVGNV